MVLRAWLAVSASGTMVDEDTLNSTLDFIQCLCVTEEGLKLIQTINPFPTVFAVFHDHRLLLSESPTLLCDDVFENLGKRLDKVCFTLNYYLCDIQLLSYLFFISTFTTVS